MVMVLRSNTAADLPEKSSFFLLSIQLTLFCSFFLFFSFFSFFRVTLFFFNCLPYYFNRLLFFFLTFPFSPSITASPSTHSQEQPHKKKPLGCHARACVTAGLH